MGIIRRVLLTLSVLYGALVLGLQIPGTIGLGVHEAAHCYLEPGTWPCQVEFHEDRTAEAWSGDRVPHLVIYALQGITMTGVMCPWFAGLRLAFKGA